MDKQSVMDKLFSYIKKYRYVILVCVLGIALMLLPEEKARTKETEQTQEQKEISENQMQQLAQILGKIQGAGKVEVMLTVSAGPETIYQTDQKASTSSGQETVDLQTVLITSSDKSQKGLVKQILSETYLGAIVVCQGADDPVVRLAIVEAVSDITGLTTDKISVLKMK